MTRTAATAPGRTVLSTIFVAAWPALMFVLAGDARWLEGWLFALWLVGVYLAITLWMHLKNPDLLAERRRRSGPGEGDQATRADRPLVLLIFLGFVVWIVLMPLDARRYQWTAPTPLAEHVAGGLLLLFSAVFLFRAVRDNTFLSGVVRVQEERGQHVVSSGVYAMVRHPMYLGMALMFIGTPLLLGSRVGLAIAAGVVGVLVVRIGREERALMASLPGYADYRRTVKYRLVPWLW